MKRRLGTWAAVALVVSEVVGVGILLTPATMMRTLGSAWLPVVMWLAMGTLTAAGALCYGELTTRFPRAGGTYVFLAEGYGPRTAFAYGWMALLVMDPGLAAALSIGFAQYLLATLGLSSRFTSLAAIAALAGFGLLALRGLDANVRLLRWTATLKLGVVGLLVLAGLWRFLSGAQVSHASAPMSGGIAALAGGIVAAFFAFGGWWDLGRMSEEVEAPRRTMPVALVGGVALVTAIYLMVTVALLLATPQDSGLTDDAFVAAAGAALFGPAAGRLLSAIVTITVAGSLVAVLLGAPRTYLAMVRDGVLPVGLHWFDEVRGRSPVGTTVQVSLAAVLVLLGTFDQILGYFVPAAVFFLGLSAAALFRIHGQPSGPHVFLTPWYPLPLVVFLALIVLMLLLFAAGTPLQTALGAAVVCVGALLYRKH
ncbi:MAG: amino acid permease [Vicinamibacterales bacterium]